MRAASVQGKRYLPIVVHANRASQARSFSFICGFKSHSSSIVKAFSSRIKAGLAFALTLQSLTASRASFTMALKSHLSRHLGLDMMSP